MEGPTAQDDPAALRQRIAFLEGCARELAAQRDLLGERAANYAGEIARRADAPPKETA